VKNLKLTVTVKFEDWVAFQIPTLPENKDIEPCTDENSRTMQVAILLRHSWDLLGNEHASSFFKNTLLVMNIYFNIIFIIDYNIIYIFILILCLLNNYMNS